MVVATFCAIAIGMGMGGSKEMVPEGQALPGRAEQEVLSNVHFVLKTPLRPPFPDGMKTAVVATGCYWGTEKGFWRMPGVYSTATGYTGGFTPNPTYREACSGQTGHTEAVLVVYDPEKLAYSDILRQFFESHDPCQYMGQGGDHGTQYRGGIYYATEEERALAEAAKASYEATLGSKIHTEIEPVGEFYYAHEEYQQYLARPGSRQYCSAQPHGVPLAPFEDWAPEELKEAYAPKLPAEYWAKYGPKPHCVIKGPVEQIVWPE